MTVDRTRDTFQQLKDKHYSRVLMQQGRVQLDADFNEQASILLHYLQTLAADLIGPAGGPEDGFVISKNSATDFNIAKGRYYVDGILCENEDDTTYKNQPDYFPDPESALSPGLVYLDVWEREITYVQDDAIREGALGGQDTAARSKVVWQVKIDPGPHDDKNKKSLADLVKKLNDDYQPTPTLQARVRPEVAAASRESMTHPDSKFTGPQNQLYRVEIHNSGPPGEKGTATFKWSRENGAVFFPIVEGGDTEVVVVEHLGRDERFSLKVGDWVEVHDDWSALMNSPSDLAQVKDIQPSERMGYRVVLSCAAKAPIGGNREKHPLLRRWDQKQGDPKQGGLQLNKDGAAQIEDRWLLLEDGLEIRFQFPTTGSTTDVRYRSGDHWLIPARTETGEVEWPADGEKAAVQPHGVVHHYAPLGTITVTNGIPEFNHDDYRKSFSNIVDRNISTV